MLTTGRRPRAAVLALLPALLAAACTSAPAPPPSAPSSVTIGLLTPLSGADAALGKEASQGSQLAVDVVNNPYEELPLPLGPGAGLRNGAKLALVTGDTEGAPELVEQRASRLVRDGAQGLVLADDAGVARAAGREADLIRIAMIDALSTADAFAELNRTGHFRIQPSDRTMVAAGLGLLHRERPARTIRRIAIAAGNPAGLAGEQVAAVRKAITDLGSSAGISVDSALNIPLAANATGTTGDPAGALVRDDVVFAIVTNSDEAAKAADLAGRLRGTAPVIALGPGVDALNGARPTQSVLRTAGWSADSARRHPIAQAVAALYERRFGGRMTEVAAAAFSATLAMAVAMDSVPEVTAISVRAAVQQLAMPATQTIMPWDGIRFDGSGNNQLAAAVIEQRSASGFQVVHPVELAATTINWG